MCTPPPPLVVEVTRGLPTSYAAPPLNEHIAAGADLPPVWPYLRGVSLEPLYKTVPPAALRDERLYELLALIDALREGRARERNLAEKELTGRLRRVGHERSQSSPARSLSQLLRGHDDGAAGSTGAAPVGVGNARIEIQGVARVERMLLAAQVHAQCALNREDELDAGMIVRP